MFRERLAHLRRRAGEKYVSLSCACLINHHIFLRTYYANCLQLKTSLFTVRFITALWARYSIFLQVSRINGPQPQNGIPPLSRETRNTELASLF
jgi:hypothetical protein